MKIDRLQKISVVSVLVIILGYLFVVLKITNIDLLLDPGKVTPLSPVYHYKAIREVIQSWFIFGDEDTAHWYLTLAQKRATESILLKNRGFNQLSQQQYQQAIQLQTQSAQLIQTLATQTNINYLQDKYNQNQDILSQFPSPTI